MGVGLPTFFRGCTISLKAKALLFGLEAIVGQKKAAFFSVLDGFWLMSFVVAKPHFDISDLFLMSAVLLQHIHTYTNQVI